MNRDSLVYIKVIFMLGALVAVVSIMQKLNSNPSSVSGFFAGMGMGLDSNRSAKPGTPNLQPAVQKNFRLCRTRIKSIKWSNHNRIAEEPAGMRSKWLAYDPSPSEIAYLDMEKWLSQNCEVSIVARATLKTDIIGFQTLAEIFFVDNSSDAVEISTGHENVFRMRGQEFQSPALGRALVQLYQLAGYKQPLPAELKDWAGSSDPSTK